MGSRATVSSTSSYAILGCGSVGHAVAEELTERGTDVLIVDKDESRVESLRDQDLTAQTADIREDGTADLVANRDVVLILSSDVGANLAAVEAIRSESTPQFVVARANDPISSDELSEAGADVVINPSAVIADAALRALESGELEQRATRLGQAIESTAQRLAILTHENPDPDAIASAAALQAIATHLGVEADIVYVGDIGRQEHRAFVNLLDIELRSFEDIDEESYDVLALIDHADTNGFELEREVDIYISHEELVADYEPVFRDSRPNVRATSTILSKYLQEYAFTVAEPVATALLYGIRSATLDFRRDTTPADLTAAAYLYPFADHDTLEQVESPSMSPETLDVLAEAITNREVQGSHLVSAAGFIRDRDAVAQAAQELLTLEGITTTAVFGIVENTIHLAARSKDVRLNIGSVLHTAFSDIGDVAGHSTQASVEIPLGIFTGLETSEENRETLLSLAEEAVTRKLLGAIGTGDSDSTDGS